MRAESTMASMNHPEVELSPEEIKAELLNAVQRLYDSYGITALSATFLAKQKGKLYRRLLALGMNQSALQIGRAHV